MFPGISTWTFPPPQDEARGVCAKEAYKQSGWRIAAFGHVCDFHVLRTGLLAAVRVRCATGLLLLNSRSARPKRASAAANVLLELFV